MWCRLRRLFQISNSVKDQKKVAKSKATFFRPQAASPSLTAIRNLENGEETEIGGADSGEPTLSLWEVATNEEVSEKQRLHQPKRGPSVPRCQSIRLHARQPRASRPAKCHGLHLDYADQEISVVLHRRSSEIQIRAGHVIQMS